MIIAVASGKGGTGKTTLTVNLARVLMEKAKIYVLDCDVEEPNVHLFLQVQKIEDKIVNKSVPELEPEICSGCLECVKMCQFNALVEVKAKPMVFSELCHSCGGCVEVCPTKALTEKDFPIGKVSIYEDERYVFVEGRLDVGQPMSPPVIKAVKKHLPNDPKAIAIIDAPPGTSCPVIASLHGADFILLVTEPTPFGLHDLDLAVKTVKELKIPMGVVVNRVQAIPNLITKYCTQNQIPLLLHLPLDQEAARLYSQGKILVDHLPEFKEKFQTIVPKIQKILQEVQHANQN